MRKNIINSLVVVLLVCTAMSCKTRKKALVSVPAAGNEAAISNKKAENLNLLRSKDLPFHSLSMKGKVTLDLDGNSNTVNVSMRISKDQKIWMSITAIAGIEVARVLITPDSILVRNNLQAVALKKPFSYVSRYSSKQISFKMLQAIMTGNTIPEFMTSGADLQLSEGNFSLAGTQGTLGYHVDFNSLFKTAQLTMNDEQAGQALKVSYGDYQQTEESFFPSVLKISALSGRKRTVISFDFSKTERNLPLDFPFSVPKRFEIIN